MNASDATGLRCRSHALDRCVLSLPRQDHPRDLSSCFDASLCHMLLILPALTPCMWGHSSLLLNSRPATWYLVPGYITSPPSPAATCCCVVSHMLWIESICTAFAFVFMCRMKFTATSSGHNPFLFNRNNQEGGYGSCCTTTVWRILLWDVR